MPLNRKALPLEADPQAVQRARRWVKDIFQRLERDDLLDAAELGVSELVTNAILHAEPPITVRVRGTRDHPRVEVRDRSPRPPEVNVEMADEENLLSTIGRGLGIVAVYSQTWGSEITDEGKTVWFEPTAQIRTDGDLSGEVFDFTEVVESKIASTEPPEEMITVRLLDMPVRVFAHFRNRYSELRRELRLLALAHGNDYPVAKELSELFLQVEAERRVAKGVDALDQAIEEGRERVDLEYRVPPSAPESMGKLLSMLEEADRFCREQRLLVIAATTQQLELQRWYLGEFQRQARGEPPIPWQGSFVVDTADLVDATGEPAAGADDLPPISG